MPANRLEPAEPDLAIISRFLLRVIHLCRTHNASITSAYRTASHNQAVGGTPSSKHLRGLAADVVLDQVDGGGRLILHAQQLGLFALDEHTHVHLHDR